VRLGQRDVDSLLEAAPSSALVPAPCMRTRNSFFIRLLASDSPSDREPARASISSMKMMDGLLSCAISKRLRTRRSDSPSHLETRSEEEIE